MQDTDVATALAEDKFAARVLVKISKTIGNKRTFQDAALSETMTLVSSTPLPHRPNIPAQWIHALKKT